MPHTTKVPICHGCGKYTCTDCGAGFPSHEEYLRHRTDLRAHAPGEADAAQA